MRKNVGGVKQGDVYFVAMDAKDGITPHDGHSTRNKFFIVLGFDGEGNVYGGVVINSQINKNLARRIADFQYPIRSDKYPFLRCNSFVDCLKLKTTSLAKLTNSKFVGSLDAEDLELITGAVVESPMEHPARLRSFGLIE